MTAQKALRGIWEPTARRIRVKLNGEIIADSTNAMLMRESGYDIHYFFPLDDVRAELLQESDFSKESRVRGNSQHWHVQVGDRVAEEAAFTYPEQKEGRPDFSGYVAFDWGAMDHWYEEAEEIFVHPRDPYHRVDTVKSDRHIKVVVDGAVIAESDQPYLLFETGLPTRYYIPIEDVNMDYLEATDLHTDCPYKGVASYWNIIVDGNIRENVVWGYPDPIDESPRLRGTVAFYNEKLDIYVDGDLEEKPRTVFA